MLINLLQNTNVKGLQKSPLNGRYVYFISNHTDEIIYVGQTMSSGYRFENHRAKAEYKHYRAIEISDNLEMNDVEFMFIVLYRPKYNRQFPTPSFLTTINRIKEGCLESVYDLDNPTLSLVIAGKTRNFWLKTSYIGNQNAALCIDFINELESK